MFDLKRSFLQYDSFHEFIATINEALGYVQMEIRPAVLQEKGEVFYGLVNKAEDEHAKLGTRLSHAQVSLFKAVVEAIAQCPEASGSIGKIEFLNLQLPAQENSQGEAESSQAAALRYLSKTEKQLLLDELTSQKWLSCSDDGVSLGIQTYLELKSYLKSMDGVPSCELCNEAAINAQVCSNPDCSARLHHYCAQRKFRRATVSRRCSNDGCEAEWQLPSGFPTEAEEADGNHSKQTTEAEAGGNRLRRRVKTRRS